MTSSRSARLVALALAGACAGTAFAQQMPAWEINLPGVYGRVELTPPPGVVMPYPVPAPEVIYPKPVVVTPAPVAVVQRPIYLYVPPGHAKDWAKHCAQYAACGQPVLFVQDRWIRDRYAERQAWEREHGHGHGKGHGHGHDRDDDDDDHDHGHGHGHGHDR
jgi:hypothetical protein